jgi:FMN-dependent NADH-azoreductase
MAYGAIFTQIRISVSRIGLQQIIIKLETANASKNVIKIEAYAKKLPTHLTNTAKAYYNAMKEQNNRNKEQILN